MINVSIITYDEIRDSPETIKLSLKSSPIFYFMISQLNTENGHPFCSYSEYKQIFKNIVSPLRWYNISPIGPFLVFQITLPIKFLHPLQPQMRHLAVATWMKS